jgi:uncharacterized phage-associated protein
MYEARKICNFVIARYGAQVTDLTNLRINKLLYFVHGWSLTSRAEGLVRNHFEAWQLGPVVRSVYDAFKVYGEERITAAAEYLDYATGETKPIPHSDIRELDIEIIERVFENYSRYSTPELVALSHEPDGPWDRVFKDWSRDKRISPRIPNDLIRKRFLQEVGGQLSH